MNRRDIFKAACGALLAPVIPECRKALPEVVSRHEHGRLALVDGRYVRLSQFSRDPNGKYCLDPAYENAEITVSVIWCKDNQAYLVAEDAKDKRHLEWIPIKWNEA